MDSFYDPGINCDVMPSDLGIAALLYIYDNDGFGLPNNFDPEVIPDSYTLP